MVRANDKIGKHYFNNLVILLFYFLCQKLKHSVVKKVNTG